MFARRLSRSLLGWGVGCFVVAAAYQLAVFFGMCAALLGSGDADSEGGIVLAGLAYLATCVVGIPVMWAVLLVQSVFWLPVLMLAATRSASARVLAAAAAPLAGTTLYSAGLVDSHGHLARLNPLGPPSVEPMLLEAIALLLTTARCLSASK